MTQDFDEGVVIRKGLASLAVREETGRRWWAVGRRMIGRGGGWRDGRIIRETHDAGDSTPARETVRRRYRTGLRNFLTLYQDRTTTWSLFDSSRPQLRLIAEHLANGTLNVYGRDTWERIAHHSDED